MCSQLGGQRASTGYALCGILQRQNLDGRLWDHVVASCAKDASKAAEIRTVLAQKLGKTDAKQILKSCVATVARDRLGQKNRVLNADGKL